MFPYPSTLETLIAFCVVFLLGLSWTRSVLPAITNLGRKSAVMLGGLAGGICSAATVWHGGSKWNALRGSSDEFSGGNANGR